MVFIEATVTCLTLKGWCMRYVTLQFFSRLKSVDELAHFPFNWLTTGGSTLYEMLMIKEKIFSGIVGPSSRLQRVLDVLLAAYHSGISLSPIAASPQMHNVHCISPCSHNFFICCVTFLNCCNRGITFWARVAHIENVIVIIIPGRPQDLESLTQMDRIRTKIDRNWMYKTPLVDQTKRETT